MVVEEEGEVGLRVVPEGTVNEAFEIVKIVATKVYLGLMGGGQGQCCRRIR